MVDSVDFWFNLTSLLYSYHSQFPFHLVAQWVVLYGIVFSSIRYQECIMIVLKQPHKHEITKKLV